MSLKYIIVLILCLIVNPITCARILGIFPYPSKSHMTVFSSLTRELARRGHELVVASPFPLSKPMINYTDIDLMPVMAPLHEDIFNADVYEFASFPLHLIPPSFWEEGIAVTETALSQPEVLALLNDKKGFDLVIAESFISEAIYTFAHHFKVPLVLISSMNGMHWINYGVGTPFPLSCSPNPMLTYTDHMTFWERAQNSIFTTLWNIGNHLFYFPSQDDIIKRIFGPDSPSAWELQRSASLVLLNTHLSLNYPRPLVPAMVEVGGMHVDRKVEKLPHDIQKFLDDAKEGAIYFSMGSNLRSDAMPAARRQAFMDAFSELPQRVLWKWESDSLPGQPNNVKLGKWLPQQGILAHPNVRVFITHGGLLSLQEAAFHGIPLVGIPVFGDQMLNMRKAELGGYGVMVTLQNVTKESVLWALRKTIYDPSIQREAKRRSDVFNDQLQSPLDRAVFWTEYVLRHKGASHLRSAALDLNWFQLYLLDVTAAILVFTLLIIFSAQKLCKLCCRTSSSSAVNNSKSKELGKRKKHQ